MCQTVGKRHLARSPSCSLHNRGYYGPSYSDRPERSGSFFFSSAADNSCDGRSVLNFQFKILSIHMRAASLCASLCLLFFSATVLYVLNTSDEYDDQKPI